MLLLLEVIIPGAGVKTSSTIFQRFRRVVFPLGVVVFSFKFDGSNEGRGGMLEMMTTSELCFHLTLRLSVLPDRYGSVHYKHVGGLSSLGE